MKHRNIPIEFVYQHPTADFRFAMEYTFDPADYTVAVTAGVPGSMAATFDDDGGYDSTTDVTLGFGEDNTTTNFGYAVPVALGDRVFADVNGDGAENGVDFGIDGLTVTLTGPSDPGGTTGAVTTAASAPCPEVHANSPEGRISAEVPAPVART